MCTSQYLIDSKSSDIQDHCFICLENTGDIYTHCKCNLKVHKKCFARLIENELSTGKKIECSVCKNKYIYRTIKSVKVLSINLIVTFSFIFLLLQVAWTIYHSLIYTHSFIIIINTISSYILFLFNFLLLYVYRRQTNSYRWWSLRHLSLSTNITTFNDFSINITNKTHKKCCYITNTDLHIQVCNPYINEVV